MAHPKKQRRPSIPELAPYERELPPLTEAVKLAAILGPRDNPNEAFRRVIRFYSRAAQLYEAYVKMTLAERADFCARPGEYPSAFAEIDQVETHVPEPSSYQGNYDEFLRIVVKGKDEAQSTKRLRDFFRSRCPKGKDANTWAPQRLKILKKEGFGGDCDFQWNSLLGWPRNCKPPTENKWYVLGNLFLDWWKEQRAEQNRKNRRGKTKKSLTEA